MSRKREEQRDNKRTLARQMGVSGREVPRELIDNERVTEPTLAVRATLEHRASGGLLARLLHRSTGPDRLDVHLCLWCCSSKQVRLVRSIAAHGVVSDPGPITLQARDDDHGHAVVRYRRPGFFVVTALVTIGRSQDGADADDRALRAADHVGLAGADAVSLLSVASSTTPVPITVAGLSTAPSTPPLRLQQAMLVARAAADRVKEPVSLPLTSADGHCQLRLAIDLRL